VKVQPVSAAFTGLHGLPMGRENRPLFAWYGDMEMVPHLWEALRAGPLDVVVQFHEPLSLDRMDRKALAAQARKTVQAGLAQALAGRS
jgi:lyso-ornithine lipid O-acyltransferase